MQFCSFKNILELVDNKLISIDRTVLKIAIKLIQNDLLINCSLKNANNRYTETPE